LLAATFIGDTQTTVSNYWCRPPIIAAVAISVFLCAVGLWALGSAYLGWPWPKTHAERMQEKAERREAQRFAYFNLRDALWEIRDELNQHRRDLGADLSKGRRFFGSQFAHAHRNKHASAFNDPRFHEMRAVIWHAYDLTHDLNRKEHERWSSASHDDVNDAEWLKLSPEDITERQEALAAVNEALSAVEEALESEPQP
jgi:hypothetical protein